MNINNLLLFCLLIKLHEIHPTKGKTKESKLVIFSTLILLIVIFIETF